jgi:hypothetical protein
VVKLFLDLLTLLDHRIFSLLDRGTFHPRRVIAGIGIFAFLGCALVGAIMGIRGPAVNDEFAYLLQADTFASGRITNPTHPLWPHFWTFHVIHEPTYTGKYPPAQGLFLALGQVLGHPIIGVWLSVGLLCSALTWMLLAWLPARWAILGGSLAAVQFGLISYWAQSYWGGAVAGFGGALLFGSVRRLVVLPRARDGVLLGSGLLLLANSRPFEGLFVSIPAAVILGHGWYLKRVDRRSLLRGLIPTVVLIALGGIMMAYYNWRTTQHPFRMPYQVYAAQYSVVPSFMHQDQPDISDNVQLRIPELEAYNSEYVLPRYRAFMQPIPLVVRSTLSIWRYLVYYLGPGLIALVALRRLLRHRQMLNAFLISFGLLLVSSLLTAAHPHYIAPATGLLFVVLLGCLMLLYDSQPPKSQRLVIGIVLLFLPFQLILKDSPHRPHFARSRAALLQRLQQQEGKHLVIVRYGSGHSYFIEWVHNRADIDNAKVVWARDLGQENQEVIDYFSDRRVWYLNVDGRSEVPPRWFWAP